MKGRLKGSKGTPLQKEAMNRFKDRAFERAEATHKKPTKEEFPPMKSQHHSIAWDYDQGHR